MRELILFVVNRTENSDVDEIMDVIRNRTTRDDRKTSGWIVKHFEKGEPHQRLYFMSTLHGIRVFTDTTLSGGVLMVSETLDILKSKHQSFITVYELVYENKGLDVRKVVGYIGDDYVYLNDYIEFDPGRVFPSNLSRERGFKW